MNPQSTLEGAAPQLDARSSVDTVAALEPDQVNGPAGSSSINHSRLVALLKAAAARCNLDLSGLTVLTEAATGGYSITPVLAAFSSATRVYAMTRSTRFGSVEDVIRQTRSLASLCGVEDKIHFITKKTRDVISRCDLITNSGHLRPLDAEFISWMKPGAVISLMYEAWELRSEDVDLAACRRHGIPVAGVNEANPAVDVFSYLPVIAAKQLFDAGVPVYGTHILLLCDNRFEPYLQKGLSSMGAEVDSFPSLAAAPRHGHYDAVLVSITPQARPVVSRADARVLAEQWPGAVVAQFFGDIDREALSEVGLSFRPLQAPHAGHMGVYMTDVGPDAVVRLQSGGLKVGEILARGLIKATPPDRDFLQLL